MGIFSNLVSAVKVKAVFDIELFVLAGAVPSG